MVSALATALRSEKLALVLMWIRDNGTKEAAAIIGKNAATISSTLQELATWEELSAAMVQGQITGALTKAGLAANKATIGGYYIRLLLSETFF